MKTNVLTFLASFLILLFLAFLPQQVQAQFVEEKIYNFDSIITVNKDGSLLVEETIKVQANGNQIRHGIYRDFPTKYSNWLYGSTNKGFNVLKVLKNDTPEPYSIKQMQNGVRVYIGDSEKLISPGIYTYKITYETTEQAGIFSDHDELYWNVTGNGWVFPIENAKTEILLPGDITPTETTGYVGPQDSKEQSNSFSITKKDGKTVVTGQLTRPLLSYEGYTVVVTWPKGFMNDYPWYIKLGRYLPAISGIALALSVILFYYWHWLRVGRDRNEHRPTVVQYTPPKDITPAQMRFIDNLGSFDNNFLSSALINLAVKGYIKIEQKSKNEYIIRKTAKDISTLNEEEKTMYTQMFNPSNQTALPEDKTIRGFLSQLVGTAETVDPQAFYIRKTNWRKVKKLQDTLNTYFDNLRKEYVVSNRSNLLWAGIPFGIFVLINLNNGLGNLGLIAYLSIIVTIVTLIIFFFALPRRTPQGLAIQDQIDGFKIFLKSQAHYVTGVKMDLPAKFSMYEKYLPFAIALGVDPQWSAQFKDTFKQMEAAGMQTTPSWYIGRGTYAHFSSASFGSSFSSTISSSSTDPTSHSGSGGGGSSGGGGGGGGGGGW